MNFNRVIVAGRLTRDVELRHLQSGTAVTDITLAVNRKRKDKNTNEWIEECEFIDITLWGRTAEVAAEYLSKGSCAHVEGRLTKDEWTDKDTGEKRSRLKVTGEHLQLVGGKSDGGSGRSSKPQQTRTESYAPAGYDAGDDVPF